MALIKCPECGKDVSTQAAACPHCGYRVGGGDIPTHESTTKRSSRHLKAIGALMTIVAIPGCIATASSGSSSGIGIWVAVFFIGFVVFIIGRFQD